MSFGAFSAFWTTLAFHLARPPFDYGSGVVGALGSYAGAWGWGIAGWGGVCLVGLGMTVAGLIVFVATVRMQLSRDPMSGVSP